jgi:hypothetical protein
MKQPIERWTRATSQSRTLDRASLPGQVVLVLQAAARWVPIRQACTRHCRKRASSRTGSSARPSEPSTPASSLETHRRTACLDCANSGAGCSMPRGWTFAVSCRDSAMNVLLDDPDARHTRLLHAQSARPCRRFLPVGRRSRRLLLDSSARTHPRPNSSTSISSTKESRASRSGRRTCAPAR